MAQLKTGSFGSYYGSLIGESKSLTYEQMKVNAIYINKYLSSNGWTTQAIAGILGNMQAESSINPGRWQSDNVGATSNGFGLVQWTPATKYINWVGENGLGDYTSMDNNLARIIYEVDNGIQWYGTQGRTFKEFTQSTSAPSLLAVDFLLSYERPADQSETVQGYRGQLAQNWYEVIKGADTGGGSSGGSGTVTPKKRKGYNFILFNKRRMSQWIRQNF